MKNFRIILGIIVVLIIKGCKEEESTLNANVDEVTGNYVGTLRSSTSVNDLAQAEISISDEDQIVFHCYNDTFDSTMVLDIYEHQDNINVCSTGEAFELEYGHIMGQGHMMHGNNTSGTSWEHHLSDEHAQGDMHYGYYEKKDQMFYYTFLMTENNTQYELNFQGVKQ
jgi:hypothetical protein